MVHTVDILRMAEVDDGAGGIRITEPEVIAANFSMRLGVMTAEEQQRGFGGASSTRWTGISVYQPLLQLSDFIRLAESSIPAPIRLGELYRVVRVRHYVDHLGGLHHTNIAMELEDVDA
jgi:hypothetical protein